eukprot:GHVL01008955.1.p1 GENE.GHVL01008955.1~~GHVL01008955.1.p1  ORF type:complete len:870 (+),score=133.99 GHVL01008955.1:115-2724(+)
MFFVCCNRRIAVSTSCDASATRTFLVNSPRLLIFLFFLCALSMCNGLSSVEPIRHQLPPHERENWNYVKHGTDWKSDTCNADTLQSPINIPLTNNKLKNRESLYWSYKSLEGAWFWKNDLESQLNLSFGQNIGGFGVGKSFPPDAQNRYRLMQTNFHSPSEHTLSGKRMPLEMHLVHAGDASHAISDSKMPVAVISVFFEESGGHENSFLSALLEMGIPNADSKPFLIGRTNPLNFYELFDKSENFFEYDGSFSQPPCKTGVRWYIKEKPLKASRRQIALIGDALIQAGSGNFRLIQESHNRPIKTIVSIDARRMKFPKKEPTTTVKDANPAVEVTPFEGLSALPTGNSSNPFVPDASSPHRVVEKNRILWKENLQAFDDEAASHWDSSIIAQNKSAKIAPAYNSSESISTTPISIEGHFDDHISLTLLEPMKKIEALLGDDYKSIIAKTLTDTIIDSMEVIEVTDVLPGFMMVFNVLQADNSDDIHASEIVGLLTDPSKIPTKSRKHINSKIILNNPYLAFTDVTLKPKYASGNSLASTSNPRHKDTSKDFFDRVVIMDADQSFVEKVFDMEGSQITTDELLPQVLSSLARMLNVKAQRFQFKSWLPSTNVYIEIVPSKKSEEIQRRAAGGDNGIEAKSTSQDSGNFPSNKKKEEPITTRGDITLASNRNNVVVKPLVLTGSSPAQAANPPTQTTAPSSIATAPSAGTKAAIETTPAAAGSTPSPITTPTATNKPPAAGPITTTPTATTKAHPAGSAPSPITTTPTATTNPPATGTPTETWKKLSRQQLATMAAQAASVSMAKNKSKKDSTKLEPPKISKKTQKHLIFQQVMTDILLQLDDPKSNLNQSIVGPHLQRARLVCFPSRID